MLQSKGKLIYNPVAGKAQNPWWIILETPKDILDYYHYWILKEKNIKLQKPLFGSHISVVRGEEPNNNNKSLWLKYQHEIIDFKYDNMIETDNNFWWLPVQSSRLEELRYELGLHPTPEHNFHLTLGREY